MAKEEKDSAMSRLSEYIKRMYNLDKISVALAGVLAFLAPISIITGYYLYAACNVIWIWAIWRITAQRETQRRADEIIIMQDRFIDKLMAALREKRTEAEGALREHAKVVMECGCTAKDVEQAVTVLSKVARELPDDPILLPTPKRPSLMQRTLTVLSRWFALRGYEGNYQK